MKKTFSALLMAGLMPLTVADSLAASTGTINFTGRVANSTCTVTGMDHVITMPIYNVAEISALGHGELIGSLAKSSEELTLVNCPESLSTASLKIDFIAESDGNTIKPESGSIAGVYSLLSVSTNRESGYIWGPGSTRRATIKDGEAIFKIGQQLRRNVNDPSKGTPAEAVSEGTYNTTANLSLSYE